MTRLEAHGIFAAMQDRGDVARWPGVLGTEEQGAAAMTGLVAIGGALDDAADEAELMEGALHGWALLDMGVVTEHDWGLEIDAAIDDVLRWGGGVDAKLAYVAKKN